MNHVEFQLHNCNVINGMIAGLDMEVGYAFYDLCCCSGVAQCGD